jgi:serine/threonine protein kinase
LLSRAFAGTQRYHLVRPLGEGSFGAVFEVLDRERETRVALKLLTHFDAPSLYRFKAEFRAFADVHHPNLVQLYDLGSHGDDWFFTMELVDGADWLSYVRGSGTKHHDSAASTLDPSSATQLDLARAGSDGTPRADVDRLYASTRQLAAAVGALHAAGIVHRDVKPSNVLVDRSGRAVLVDFGLARPLANGTASVTGAHVAGTPAYMAPEQATSVEVTAAADWYAVGVMLFEALTGRLPFDGTALTILARKQSEDAPSPASAGSSGPSSLEALCASLLAREPGARPTAQTILDVLGAHHAKARASRAPKREAPAPERALFVGRRDAMKELREAFRHTREREGTVTALVRGPSGIGKSALVRALVDDEVVPAEGVVLAGRCYEREAVSYKAFDSAIDALSRYLVQAPSGEAAAVLPVDAAALARVFPVLDRVPAIARAPRRALQTVDAQRLRTRAFAALRELLARAADRHPVVLFLDDFQWADDESLALLRDLVRGDPSPSMLVVVTFRDEDVGRSGPLDGLLATAKEAEDAGRPVLRVALGPLAPDEALELTAATLGRPADSAIVGTIAAESGGSPFFLGELVQYALSPRADTKAVRLGTVLADRLAGLGADERRLLEVLAVAGAPIERVVASRAAGLEPGPAEPLFRALHRAKLVRTAGSERDDLLECFHNRIREAVVGALSPEAKRAHHEGIAAALQTQREPDPEKLYLHYGAAGLAERAAEHAIAAAQRAERALAFDHAARLYRSALALLPKDAPDRNDYVVRTAEALMRAGHGVESADAFLEAIAGGSSRDVLAHRHRAAEQLLFCGQLDRGLRLMEEICDQVGVSIPRSRAQAIVHILFFSVWLRLFARRWRVRDPATVTPAELTRADVCWSMAGGLSLVDQVIARPFSLRAMLAGADVGDSDRMVRALATEAGFVSSQGGARAARRADALFAAADALPGANAPGSRAFRRGVQGWSRYFFGDWRAAKPLLDDSLAELAQHGLGSIWERDTLSVYSLMVRLYLGEVAELARLTEQRLFDARNRGDLFAETIYVTSRANVRWLLTDAPDAKRREVDDALRAWGQPGRFQIQHWYAVQSHAQVDLYEGRPLDVLRRLEEAWPSMRRNFLLRVQNIRIEARSMRAFAAARVAAGGGGDREALVADIERDAQTIARERTDWGEPLAVLLRAAVARLRKDDRGALASIDDATKRFEVIGMRLHAAAARVWRGTIDASGASRAEAEAYFAAEGVKRAERAAAIFTPFV